jgi:hypothetical protein
MEYKVEQSRPVLTNEMVKWVLRYYLEIKKQVKNPENDLIDILGERVGQTVCLTLTRHTGINIVDCIDVNIQKIHPEHRRILKMRYFKRYKWRDIQEFTGITEKTLERRLAEIEEQFSIYFQMMPDESIREIRRLLE